MVFSHAQARRGAAQGAGRLLSGRLAIRRDRPEARGAAARLGRGVARPGDTLRPNRSHRTPQPRARSTQAAGLLHLCRSERGAVRPGRGARAATLLRTSGLRAMMSIRSDFFGSLQTDAPLFKARQLIEVLPLGEDELREVVSRPAQLLGARFESDGLVDIIARRTAEDSVKDVGALPLLSYTLDDMWAQMLKAGDGVLRLPAQSFELGGVLVDRANRFLAERPGAENMLKR